METVFIVYSDGKVGSTTLTVSLKKNYPNQFVFHIHRLTPESIYYNMYKEIKKSVKLPSENLDKIYSSKYVQYFYLTEEIKKFRQQWQQ